MNQFSKLFLLSVLTLNVAIINATISDANKGVFSPIEHNVTQRDGVYLVEQNILPGREIADSSGDEELGSRDEIISQTWLEGRADEHVQKSLRISIELNVRRKRAAARMGEESKEMNQNTKNQVHWEQVEWIDDSVAEEVVNLLSEPVDRGNDGFVRPKDRAPKRKRFGQ